VADAVYAARNALPVFLTRGRDNAIGITVVDSAGDAATIASGTIDVWDGNGVKVVDGAAVTVSPASYTVLAAVLPTTEPLSDAWFIRWSLTIGTTAYQFPQTAHFVRWVLSNPVTEADLTKRHPELSDLLASGDDISDLLGEAWEWVQRMLLRQGRMPWRVLDAFSLFDAVREKAWADCFRSGHAATGGSGKYGEMAAFYDDAAVKSFARVSVVYDEDDSGLPDAGEDGASVVAPLFMGGPGTWVL